MTLILSAFVVLCVFAATGKIVSTADSLSGLRSVSIKAFGDRTVKTGGSLLLSAMGDYVSYTVPVRALWTIETGDDLGTFNQACDAAETCTFLAGDRAGDIRIRIEANGFSDATTLQIKNPDPVRPVQNPFRDSIPDWGAGSIVELSNRQVIRGYSDGRFGSGDPLTRGQLITILHRALVSLKLVPSTSACRMSYRDVPAGHYAYDAACVFRDLGWLDALSTLSPDDPMSRSETASLLDRVIGGALMSAKNLSLGRIVGKGAVFTDIPASSPAFVDTAVAQAIGIMQGNPDHTFSPKKILNRAEAAAIIWRVMQELQNAKVRVL